MHAMTDVTGFGLAGHAAEIAGQSEASLVLDLGALPLLPGAERFAALGGATGGGARNRDGLGDRVRIEGDPSDALIDLLYDPQTSGGLLMALPEAGAEALRREIEAQAGGCWLIGRVEAGPPLVVAR